MTTLDASRTAVLSMDFQQMNVHRLDATERALLLERVVGLVARARQAGATIGHVRVAITDDEAALVPAANRSFTAAAQNPAMRPDAPESQIIDALAPQDGDIVVRKYRVGPFTTTDLREQLSTRGIDTLVLTGITTSGVVLSTVRQAADEDFAIVVVEDCCADFDDEVHRVLTQKVFRRQAEVVTAADVDWANVSR